MKRSEMIKKIHESLLGKPVAEMAQRDDFAENLLAFMEDMGMVPPKGFILDTDFRRVSYAPNGDRLEAPYYNLRNQWEQE